MQPIRENNQEQFFTLRELCKTLHACRNTLIREIHDGRLRAIKVGKHFRVSQSAVDEYIASQTFRVAGHV